jgi:hypothetical protein
VVAANVGVKVAVIERYGVSLEQGFVALAAVGARPHIRGFDAVGFVAVGANNVQGVGHERHFQQVIAL